MRFVGEEMADTKITLTKEEVHAAISKYVANKYNVKVKSTTIHTKIRYDNRPCLSHATADVVLNEQVG